MGVKFQSIGVTKDWRPWRNEQTRRAVAGEFPINRRHQGLATPGAGSTALKIIFMFSINRRHQGLAIDLVGGAFEVVRQVVSNQ